MHRVVLSSLPKLNANIWSAAVAFGLPLELAPSALHDVIFLPWRFNSYFHIALKLEVVYTLFVVLGLQIDEIER